MAESASRKRNRLKDYDYHTNGVYHVTICTKDRMRMLSKIIVVGEGLCALPQVVLSEIGQIVEDSILFIQENEPYVVIEKYVIMPDHVHILLRIDGMGGHGGPPLHDIIERIKTFTTHQYGKSLWQRSFYDHVIRCQQDYDDTRQYIENNPMKWVGR